MSTAPAPSWTTGQVAGMFAMALVAGSTIPVQGRLNAELAALSGAPTLASFASFFVGMLVIAAVTLGTRGGRRGLAQVRPALAEGRVRWWYFLAGVMGGLMVLSQSATIGTLGVAVFTVAVVAGQLIGGMTVDRLGLTPAGVKRLTPRRIAGAVLALAAVCLVVGPQLSGRTGGAAWVLVALIPLAVGLGTSGQQVLNARQSVAYRSALPVTLINFIAGAGFLGVVTAAVALAGGHVGSLPGTWWLYLGGVLGCVFIAFSAILVPRLGAFLTMLGLVSGKLLGSLAVDAVAPTASTSLSVWTLVGTLGALCAVALASGPRVRRPT